MKRCEHHLHANGVEAMAGDHIGGWLHYMRVRLDTAFRRTEAWEELLERAVQVGVRHLLPAHHPTAALDQKLGTARDCLGSRSFVLRNAARTNLLLGLVRLHLSGDDIERRYHQLAEKIPVTTRHSSS